ncbi:MAG: hypothetical protein IJV40_08380 [Oscillospiraceae bacterium]|nr:hypothetical protein [Oscillospiraceae bacterium]
MTRQELNALYDAYLENAIRAEQERKPLEGLFGFGRRASDDPCHERFAEDVEAWMKAFRESEPDSAAVREILSWVYRAPKEYPEPQTAYWNMMAVQGFTQELIPILNREDAQALEAEFKATYARWERMPVQKQILKALQALAGQ